MKVIDQTVHEQSNAKANMLGRISQSLNLPGGRDGQAQQVMINALQKSLDHRYVMLQNLVLEGMELPVPLVLLGPAGVQVINVSGQRGVFRAREDSWEELDERTQRFQPARPNLLSRTLDMRKAIEAQLQEAGLSTPVVEAVLFFSDPGLHVDTSRPAVRVVQNDALERFSAGILLARPVWGSEQVQAFVAALVGNSSGLEPSRAPERDAFSFLEEAPTTQRPTLRVKMDTSEPPILKKIPFSRRQWMLIGFLMLVNIVILTGFVVYLLVLS